MSRTTKVAAVLAALALAAWAILWFDASRPEDLGSSAVEHRPASTYPNYSGIVIPPNLAPLNLKILEPGRKFCLRLSAAAGAAVEVFSSDGEIRIPPRAWRGILDANRGGELRMDLYAKREDGWVRFDTVRNRVAADEIDPFVVYRYIPTIYDRWGRISIRQRDLRGFEERVVFDNLSSIDPGGANAGAVCVNCHSFLNHGASRMLLHVRPARAPQTPALILVRNGRAEKVDTRTGENPPAAYTSWHPNGQLLAFSRNRVAQIFHTAGEEVRDVLDQASDLALYVVDTGQTFTVPAISRPDRLETFPAWSADGRHLYFSSAPVQWSGDRVVPQRYDRIQYDLARIPYDPATGEWGQVQTVVAAGQLGRSISLASPSPDGRFLVFCGHSYGSFPIYQTSSDLYMLDLQPNAPPSQAVRRLDEINSGRSDSYHSWSSNSRWIIFASKREDGSFTRLYISHLGPDGLFSKPFVMPQRDPGLYGRSLMVYNRPEFLREAVTVSAAELTRAINSAAQGPRDQDSSGMSGPRRP